MNRYSRHTVLEEIGDEGQEKISGGKVTIIGVGALGTTIADGLARAGVGKILLVDRDFVELSNLQRQTLYEENDIGMVKAEVAAEHLRRVNSEIEIEFEVVDVKGSNIEGLIKGKDVVLDGTDNMETRMVINDACVKHEIPWIFSAVLRTYGMTLNMIPEKGPCLRCIMEDIPSPNSMETCASAGVLFSTPRMIGELAATEAIKYLIGERLRQGLLTIDPWREEYRETKIEKREGCPCCGKEDFLNLEKQEDLTTELCGRKAVQVSPGEDLRLDLDRMEDRYEDSKRMGETMLKLTVEGYELNLFKDGRTIVEGTDDPKKARSLYSEYIGG